jgi:DNA replication protein DnaC
MIKIEEQMYHLRFQGMMKRWESLKGTQQIEGLSLTEGLELLLQSEYENCYNRKRERLIKQANFRNQASLHEVSYLPERNLDRSTIAMLADGSYMPIKESLFR